MKYILIAGIDGAGKTSLIGVLKGFELISDDVYDDRNDNSKEISYCLENNLTFTQETTLACHRVVCPPRKNRQKNAGEKPNEKNDKCDIKLLCESAFIPRFA